MKSSRLIVLAVALALGSGVGIAPGDVLGTAFTYQGQLKDEGVPANDEYDFIFRLFDDPVGGAQVGGDVEIDEWLVSDGLFTVELDFGTDVFTGDALWLEVSVRLNDVGGEYTDLSPRQPLNATPYALYALGGPASGGFWAANGDDIYNTNTGTVGVGLTAPVFNLHVYDMVPEGEIRPPTTLGVQWQQALLPTPPNEWFYFAVGGAGPMVGSGTRLIRESGTELHFQTQDEMYSGWPSTQMMLDADGKVGIGTDSPISLLEAVSDAGVHGIRSTTTGIPVAAYRTSTSGTWPAIHAECASLGSGATAIRGYITATSPGSSSAAVKGHNNGTGGSGIGVWGSQDGSGYGVYGYTPSGRGVYGLSGDVGVYGRNDAGMGTGVYGVSVYGTGVRGESTAGMGVYAKTTTGNYALRAEAGSTGLAARFVGNVDIVSPSTGQILIELGEGLDYAEGFDVSDESEIRPGTVLVIDAENAGELAISKAPYDRKVAGIVGGANGLGSAVRLGAGQFDFDVALAGRVYCNVDASYGAIQPGDLLTTSPTPGYAMKVTDHEKAQGAILGKAMQPLKQGGQGQILVLVTLQ